jgi:hypothetical protein
MDAPDHAASKSKSPCINGAVHTWSHFLTQPAKVDSPMQRMIHHEDAETVFG